MPIPVEWLFKLVLGSYAFTGLAFAWAWLLYVRLADRVTTLFTNHVAHLEERVAALEARLGGG